MFKKGEIISLPRFGVMKAVVIEEEEFGGVRYRITKHVDEYMEGRKDRASVRRVVKGEISAFEAMIHGDMDEEKYESYIAEQRKIFKQIKRKYKAIKRRVRR